MAYPQHELVRGLSGGSTGHPLVIFSRKSDRHGRYAQRWRVDGWLGANWLWPSFKLWGVTGTRNVPAKLRPWQRLTKIHYRYASRYLTRNDLQKLAQDFTMIRPRKVTGYASFLRALAQYLLEEGRAVSRPPKTIVSTAETLSDEDRRSIEEGLGGPVYDRYATRESSAIASECLKRSGLHVLADHVYLEILRDGAPAGFGQPGYLVVTDLDGLAMPLIRYRNEDIGAWSDRECPCGRHLPLLERVFGRDTDFILAADGAAYPGVNLMRPFRPVAENGHLRQMQLRQAVAGQLEVLAVPGPAQVAEDGDRLRNALAETFRGQMQISIRWVEEIPTEPSGKTPFVKSALRLSAFTRSLSG